MLIFWITLAFVSFAKAQDLKIVITYQNDQADVEKILEDSLNSFDRSRNEYMVNYSIVKVVLNHEEEDQNLVCDTIKNGVSLILDITWSGNEEVQLLANKMGIPYLQPDFSIGATLHLLDTYLNEKQATDVLIMFDVDELIDQALYFWIDSARLRMVVPSSLDRRTVQRIKEIRPIPHSVAIVSSTKNMGKIFQQAQKEGLLHLPERWNLVFTDFRTLEFDPNLLEDLPITLVSFDEELCCDLILKDGCECPESFDIRSQFAYWTSDAILRTLKALIEEKMNFPENMECNVTMFPEPTTQRFNQIITGIFNESGDVIKYVDSTVMINPRGIIQLNKNGSLQRIAKINDFRVNVEKNERIQPIKAYYRIGIAHALPWSYKEKNPDTGEWFWTGYCADFARKLSEKMNFDFEFVEPDSSTVGEKVNGTWNGVVGDLARGDTDLAITAIIMTADKEEVIDFVAPYFEQTGITIVMRKPVRKTSLFKFMTVLKLEVWLSIVAALVVTGFMIWFLDKYSPYSARNNKKAYPYPCREFTLKESFWFALTSFTPQGGGEAPKALSGRTLVAAYWLFVVLMLATFTANLAAFLTVERMQAPVQSLEQLARQSRINYTVVKNSETHKYFINMKNAENTLYRMWKELTLNASTDTDIYRVWDYPIREQYGHILLAINDSNPVRDAAEGFRIVDEHLNADFAFIHDSSEIKYEISRNCNFTEVGEIFAEKPYAVAVQQGSHLQDDLSKVILDLQKDRFFEELQAKYWNHSAKGDCPSTDDNEGITLESLGGVFIATLFGLALAMITLAGEVIYYRRKGKIQNPKNISKEPPNRPMGLPPKYGDLKHFKNVPKTITIGTEFKPVNQGKRSNVDVQISHINLYPRARNKITQVD